MFVLGTTCLHKSPILKASMSKSEQVGGRDVKTSEQVLHVRGTRAATIMRRIIPHNSAQSLLNLHPHNSPHNWTKFTRDAAYFWEMELRYYNTWLFSEIATRCLHQITSAKVIIDRKRAKCAQNFQFSFDTTIHHFDFIMSDSTDSELESVNPSPVRAYTNSSVAKN